MNVKGIPNYEASFRNSGLDGLGKQHVLKPFSIKIPGETTSVPMIDCKRSNNDSSFYYNETAPKNKILLHFTAGYLKGDISTMTTPGNHVSVPFVLARSGDIYNLWPSKLWSYHLGSGASGGNTEMSKTSVAIEISNIGALKKIGNNLVTMYSDTDVYCTLDETSYYTFLKTPYRGFQYYASYTEAQYQNLILLLRFLCKTYNIPPAFLPEAKRYNLLTGPEAVAYKGILSHVNFRSDKTDIGTAFDWAKVIAGVTK